MATFKRNGNYLTVLNPDATNSAFGFEKMSFNLWEKGTMRRLYVTGTYGYGAKSTRKIAIIDLNEETIEGDRMTPGVNCLTWKEAAMIIERNCEVSWETICNYFNGKGELV